MVCLERYATIWSKVYFIFTWADLNTIYAMKKEIIVCIAKKSIKIGLSEPFAFLFMDSILESMIEIIHTF